MTSLIEALGMRAVGTVDEVSARGIAVALDRDAPQTTALNTGVPSAFPRINGYLLVPNESGATVGVITKVQIARATLPMREGGQDRGLVDLPFPGRLVSLTPIGTLVVKSGSKGGRLAFEVRRGVDVFPSVGDHVILPTDDQLRAIVEGESAEQFRRVLIGTCPTAAQANVHVDPDKLFGRHIAVLGNTGAGKSCSVAGLIRWSLDAARAARERSGLLRTPNARFIVLDPNGEYARAFDGLGARVFQVAPQSGASALKVPSWLWNGDEWAAFTNAAPGVQRPILFNALRHLRSGAATPDAFGSLARGRLRRYGIALKMRIQAGEHLQSGKREGVADHLLNTAEEFNHLADHPECPDEETKKKFRALAEACAEIEASARGKPKPGGGHWHNDFKESTLESLGPRLDELARMIGLVEGSSVGEDTPVYFPAGELPGFVEALASDASGRDLAQFVDSMNLRIRGLFAGGPLGSVVDPADSSAMTLDGWLSDHVGADQAANGPIAVIDLSLVPSEVIHIVVAVMARMVFEAVQRYRRSYSAVLPTVLVLEEAHTFVHRELSGDAASPAGRACSRIFEKIAREGRKFGLGLVLASQRPSEMSATVLSQCNTFLLHRIVNDVDQDLVRRLVPDALGDLLRELPSLPSRRAILLGWGAPAPVLVEIRELPLDQQPHSPDPDFWKVWTGERKASVDWKAVADSWVGKS